MSAEHSCDEPKSGVNCDSIPRELAPGLFLLGNSYFNLYLVKGEQASALIEVGVSAVVDNVISQLKSLGVAPSFLVVTHPHADHVGGLPGLLERFPNALAIAGEGAPEFLAHPKSEQAIVEEDRHMSQFLASQGIIPGRPPLDTAPLLTDCMIASEGDEMDLGGVTLRFVEVAGHSPGNINVYIPELEALIASDSVGYRFTNSGFFPLFLTDYTTYVDTIRKLGRLKPEILGVAHQGPIVGRGAVQRAMDQALESAQKLFESIRSDERESGAVAEELFRKWYKEEFLLYTEENIGTCCQLLVRRAREKA